MSRGLLAMFFSLFLMTVAAATWSVT